MKTVARTERLALREFTADDAAFLLRLMNQPSYHRYIGDRGLQTDRDAAEFIGTKFLPSYERNGFGFWLMLHDGAPVGMAGMVKRDELEHPDVGYALLDDHAGHGFATEAVRGTLSLNEQQFRFPVLQAITDQDNHASIRVLEKCGFRLLEQRDVYNDGEVLNVFQLDDAEV